MIFLKLKCTMLFTLLLVGQVGVYCMNEYKTFLNGKIALVEAGSYAPSGYYRSKETLLELRM